MKSQQVLTALLGVTSAAVAAGLPEGDHLLHDNETHTSTRSTALKDHRALQTMNITDVDWRQVPRTGLTNQVKACTPQFGDSDRERDCLVEENVVAALEADSCVSGEDVCMLADHSITRVVPVRITHTQLSRTSRPQS